MKLTKRLANSLVLITLFFSSCSYEKDNCEINIIDVFISLPDVNGGPPVEKLELILEVKNKTRDNIFLEMASWMEKDKRNLTLLVECTKGDLEEIPLYFITAPIIYIDAKGINTFAVRANYQDIRLFADQCVESRFKEEEVMDKILSTGKLIYRQDSYTDIRQKDKFYKAIEIK